MHPISNNDCDILRQLAEEYLQCAQKSMESGKVELWRQLNDNEPKRPMVWVEEVPWHEMNVNDELTLLCEGTVARNWEKQLRQDLYSYRYMPADMILNPWFVVKKQYSGGALDLIVEEDIKRTDPKNRIVSHHYKAQIQSFEDVDRTVCLSPPVYLKDETEALYAEAMRVFSAIMPVRLAGIQHLWFTPWDNLIRLWGVQEALLDLYLNPELVSYAVERYVKNALDVLSSMEMQGLLSPGAGNIRVGSGGYGYLSDFPETESAEMCSTNRMWGCSNAQIFSDVSPEMHWEFALKYDIPWLSRWGANYYGCCEALHLKSEIIKLIPNLRKISMSPWANIPLAIKNYSNSYVFSIKPSPAVFVTSHWNESEVRSDLKMIIEQIAEAGIAFEIIMKDISTVGYQPQRLWDWARIAMDEAEKASRWY